MAAPLSVKGKKIIPTIWQERILKRDFDIVLGKMLQPEPRNTFDSEEFYLRSANIQWSGVDVTDIKTMWFSEQEKKFLLLRTGDLVVNEGGDVGRCAIWQGQVKECYYQNSVNRVRNQEKASTLFLYYWINNLKVAGFIDSIVAKTTIAHLTAEKLEAMPWPSIPLAEQIRIATYLDASCAAIDAAVSAKKKQLEALTALRKETIHRVVTRGLDKSPALRDTLNSWIEKIPVGWDLVCLKRISDIQTGLTLGKVYEGPTVERPYLRVANVQDGHLDLTDVTLIEVPLSVASRVRLCVDDVLMTEGGDLDKLGRGFLWKGEIADCLHQNHIFAVRCFRHKLLPMFLTYLTASRYGRDYFEATGKKTTNLAATNSTKVGAFPIPLPPIDEQERLILYLDKYLGDLTALFSNIESQIATLIDYRKSLIHECVTGQRRINEADVAKVERTLEQAAGLPQQ